MQASSLQLLHIDDIFCDTAPACIISSTNLRTQNGHIFFKWYVLFTCVCFLLIIFFGVPHMCTHFDIKPKHMSIIFEHIFRFAIFNIHLDDINRMQSDQVWMTELFKWMAVNEEILNEHQMSYPDDDPFYFLVFMFVCMCWFCYRVKLINYTYNRWIPKWWWNEKGAIAENGLTPFQLE